jgi:viroplasmin and RNaseH domain-containing protein
LRKFKEEIEGFPASLYESCDSYDQAHTYLEEYLHQEKGNKEIEITDIALAALKKIMSSVMRI